MWEDEGGDVGETDFYSKERQKKKTRPHVFRKTIFSLSQIQMTTREEEDVSSLSSSNISPVSPVSPSPFVTRSRCRSTLTASLLSPSWSQQLLSLCLFSSPLLLTVHSSLDVDGRYLNPPPSAAPPLPPTPPPHSCLHRCVMSAS